MKDANEYIRLLSSEDRSEQLRAVYQEMPLEDWFEVVDRFPEARGAVAHNKTIPLEILEILARDPDRRVRWAVVRKRKLTIELLRVLAVDGDEIVRANAARHRRADAELLDALSRDDSSFVREAVAEVRLRGK